MLLLGDYGCSGGQRQAKNASIIVTSFVIGSLASCSCIINEHSFT
jgi:hypothetical protein